MAMHVLYTLYLYLVLYIYVFCTGSRNWLLYYSIPVIVGILLDKYLRYYSHLVADIPLPTVERIAKLDLYWSFHNFYGNMNTQAYTFITHAHTPVHMYTHSLSYMHTLPHTCSHSHGVHTQSNTHTEYTNSDVQQNVYFLYRREASYYEYPLAVPSIYNSE